MAWRVIGWSTRKNENSLWPLTMPVPFTTPSDLTFSDISLIGFLADCVEDEERFASVALSKANWVASHYCIAITCHTSLRTCICLVKVLLRRMAPGGESLNHWTLHLVWVSHCYTYRYTQNHLVFVHTLDNYCTPHTIGKLTVCPLRYVRSQ